MIGHTSINNSESGQSVRAKINKMFSDLITGKEGVNSLWSNLISLAETVKNDNTKTTELYNSLQEQILKSFDYTDTQINELTLFVSGMNGGISGIAPDTSYNPEFPEDKAATVLALGSGTYTHFLDSDGAPIKITDESAFTIFYKDANSTYWRYTSLSLSFLAKKKIYLTELNDYSPLDTYDSLNHIGLYELYFQKEPRLVGRLNVHLSWGNTVVQELESFMTSFEATAMNTITRMTRWKNIGGVWSEWEPYQASFIGSGKVGKYFDEKNCAPSVEEFKKATDYTQVAEWSGIVIDDAEIETVSFAGLNDPNKIVFIKSKGVFAYNRENSYVNNWDTRNAFLTEDIENPEILKSIFIGTDKSVWIPNGKNSITLLSRKMVFLSENEYNLLPKKDSETLYYIYEE